MTADFPVDPRTGPTGLPESYDSEPGPWDEVTVESVRAELSDQSCAAASDASAPGPADRDRPTTGRAIRRPLRPEPLPESRAESDTDTFPKVEAEPAPADAEHVPERAEPQRRGIRAFAERAMGGR